MRKCARVAVLLALALAIVPACGGSHGGGAAGTGVVVASSSVDATGGTVSVTNPSSPIFGTQVVIPPGALSTSTTITIKQVAGGGPYPNDVYDFDFGPSGTVFNSPVTVTIKYQQQYLTDNGISDPTTLHIVESSPGSAPETLTTTAQDTVNHTISAQTTHFSGFAALGYTNASLSGPYTVVGYKYSPSVTQPNTTPTGAPQAVPLGFTGDVGTITFDGAGNFSISITENVDGSISSQSLSGTYSVAPDGSATFSAGNVNTGSVLAGGSVAVFGGTTTPGGSPKILLLIKQGGGTFTNATLSGDYTAISYKFSAGTQPNTPATGTPQAPPAGFTSFTGTLTFDGAGNFSGTVTQNLDGAISTPAVSGTYSVASDGTATFSAGNVNSGGVLAGGSAAIFGGTTSPGGTPKATFLLKQGGGTFTNATLSGTYTAISYKYDSSVTQPNSPATGTPQAAPLGFSAFEGILTFDGAGNFSGTITENQDGTILTPSVSGTYLVASDGTATFTAGNVNSGGVLANGSIAVFGGSTSPGGSPKMLVLIRR